MPVDLHQLILLPVATTDAMQNTSDQGHCSRDPERCTCALKNRVHTLCYHVGAEGPASTSRSGRDTKSK